MMNRQALRDESQRLLGFIEDRHDGKQAAVTPNGETLAIYDPHRNETRDLGNYYIGPGNHLASLLLQASTPPRERERAGDKPESRDDGDGGCGTFIILGIFLLAAIAILPGVLLNWVAGRFQHDPQGVFWGSLKDSNAWYFSLFIWVVLGGFLAWMSRRARLRRTKRFEGIRRERARVAAEKAAAAAAAPPDGTSSNDAPRSRERRHPRRL